MALLPSKLSDMERGLGSHHYPSIDVLITGRSGTSKSILANGIFGKEVVKERHGVVNIARSSAIEFYSNNIDGIRVNVWVSSRLQDGDVTNDAEYLRELKELCSEVDLIMYCLKMTETRFVPGNPDAQAMAKITQTLGYKCWEKTIFVLTYANVAAEVNYAALDGTLKTAFQEGIEMWKKVVQNTLSKEAGVPQSHLNINVVPAGHYRQPHLPDRDYWLSILWSECHKTISSGTTREAFHQINAARFRKVSEISVSEFSQKISDQPLVCINDKSKPKNGKIITLFGAGIFGLIGLFLGITFGSIPLAFLLFSFGLGLGGYSAHVVQQKKYFF